MSTAARAVAPQRVRILLAVVLAIAATVLALVVPPAALAASGSPSTTTLAQMTQRVLDDTNAIRSQQGLPGLVRDTRLDKVAADWAKQQWQNGAMSHNPNYSTQIPAGWTRAGENVGKGYTYTQIVPAWKNSASHYANLVNDYTSVGIGYYEQDGTRYWSQVFATYPGTAQPAPVPPTSTAPQPAAEPAAPSGAVITVSSPSFEDGLGAWAAPSASVDGPNANARGGTHSLLVPGTSGRTVSQNVTATVAAGSTHTLTVWVRADGSASGTVRLRAVGGTAETGAVNFTASDSAWLKVSIALATKTAHSGFVIEVVTATSGRTYRIDSVSLVRTGEPVATTPSPSPSPSSSSPPPSTAPSPSGPSVPAAPIQAPAPSSQPIVKLGGIRIG